MAKKTFTDLYLGPLPTDRINRVLGLELMPGDVVFTVGAQRHAARSHPADYPRCLPFTGGIVAAPLFVGDDFRNHGAIELIGRVAAIGSGILVAIGIEPDAGGFYRVHSIYPVSETKIQGRLARGFLKRI